jgi:small-conductance mechanosensitive channel
MFPVAVLFYDVVLSVHIAAIIIAFGGTFAYAPLGIFVTKANPRMLPTLHAGQVFLARAVITPMAILALLAGSYLASDRDYWSQVWVTVPLVILVVLMGLVHAFFNPHDRRAAEIAQRDIDASGAGEVKLSDEYQAVAGRLAQIGAVAGVLILVAVLFMVTKLGA